MTKRAKMLKAFLKNLKNTQRQITKFDKHIEKLETKLAALSE